MGEEQSVKAEQKTLIERFFVLRDVAQRRFQNFLDRTTPFVRARWAFVVLLAIIYGLRVYFAEGWYIVTYALAIYFLNRFIYFLSPKIDPDALDPLSEEAEGDGAELPLKMDDEFKPFIRKLPEFRFWLSTVRAFCLALGATLFEAFNVPVFWPILLLYWLVLFVATMKQQIRHMIKHRYLPWTRGKPSYKSGKEEKKDAK